MKSIVKINILNIVNLSILIDHRVEEIDKDKEREGDQDESESVWCSVRVRPCVRLV